MLAIAVFAPAVAHASDTASVVNGVVQIQGDANDNVIAYAGRDNGSGGLSYGALVEDSAPGETFTLGPGCSYAQSGGQTNEVLCGTPDDTSITIDGGDGNDTIESVGPGYTLVPWASVYINGGNGDDLIKPDDGGLGGDLDENSQVTVDGGPADDTIEGAGASSNGHYTFNGDDGDDTLTGGSGNDIINGGDGNDTIDGGDGDDQVYGDAGNDQVYGGSQDDLVDGGPGSDTLCGDCSGGSAGNDTIDAVDGTKDSVSCGLGTDTANVDDIDEVDTTSLAKCETVNVTATVCPAGQLGTPPDCTTPPPLCPAGQTGTPPDCMTPLPLCPMGDIGTPPHCVPNAQLLLLLPKHQSPVKSKKLLATVGCSITCYTVAHAQVKVGKRKRFQVDSKLIHLTDGGKKTISLTFSHRELKKLKAALKHHTPISTTVTTVLVDSTGKLDFAHLTAKRLKISG